ncbi:uncharacterized protein C8A04DRAFT_24032 [Dichotomopilus funicola]|uniref:Uncharacterized protein n=1 Tax=Dichotomopilus funicola TaxID=1934379 RepID=A0AAN6VB94_9PEZI|nr:hypothetical protein C8A04DRAFT_24032 [Dichotomopilus funicola]
MTQLTIPTLEAQGSGSTPQTAATAVQELDIKGSPAEEAKTTHQHGSIGTPMSTQTELGARPVSDHRTLSTPRTPGTAEASFSRVSRDERSASELIDDWFTALHNSTQDSVAPEFSGAVRRRSAGMASNVSKAPKQSPAAARRARNSVCVLPKATPIRFSAENPDDWVPLEEWDSAASTRTQSLAPVDEDLGEHGEGLDVVATGLKNVHISQVAIQANVEEGNCHERQTGHLEQRLKGP